jgi:replicative DNA helicase
MPPVTFDFDEAFQTKIAAHFMRDESFARRTIDLIQPELFDTLSTRILIKLAVDHFTKYNTVPSSVSVWSQLLKDAIASNMIRSDVKADVFTQFKLIHKENLAGQRHVEDEISKFSLHQAIQETMIECVDLLQQHRFEDIKKKMEQAFRTGVDVDTDDIVEYWSTVEQRTNVRKDVASGLIKPQGITTGIKQLDNLLYHKGWGRKELSVFLGAAKRGKSTALIHFSILASLAGFNVFYVTAEVAGSIVADRMDANVSGLTMDEIRTRINDVHRKVESRGIAGKVGRIDILEVPTGSFKPMQLRRILDKQMAKGITYDMVVPDYADIMAPDEKTNDAIENSKSIWIGLRSIAQEYNLAMLTATQANRDGAKAETTKDTDVAEDFNKVRIADIMISINRTEQERKRNQARLFLAASRNQAGEVSITIKQNIESMNFIEQILAIN